MQYFEHKGVTYVKSKFCYQILMQNKPLGQILIDLSNQLGESK